MLASYYETGWIRSWQFDQVLILGCLVLSLVLGSLSYIYPNYYHVILFLNIWLLGYHHVIATYTRFLESSVRQEHRWLITWLPIVVAMFVISIAVIGGIWTLATVYLYWQFFHYARQSHGIAQFYRHKANQDSVTLPQTFHNILIYGVPLWGILHRSAQQPNSFLDMPVKVIPYSISFPLEMVTSIIMLIALLGYCIFIVHQVKFKCKKLALGYHLFIVSHVLIFYLGYIFIDNINRGWLFLNIWHNSQYIAFVWLFNVNRSQKIDTEPKNQQSLWGKFSGDSLYDWLCTRNIGGYFFTTFASTFIFYFIIIKITNFTIDFTGSKTMLITMIVYQTINFHHYIIDACIWKMRKKTLPCL
jgi:hypothetical protein